jgi:predicted RNA-binding protein with PIN domain
MRASPHPALQAARRVCELSLRFYSSRMSAISHLIVDGSNVLQAWPDTCAIARSDREAARTLLIRRMAGLHDGAGWRITVVFDGRGDALQFEPVGGAADFACIYTPSGTTADDIIEQLVAKSADPAACLVATADQAERATVEAAGAAWCSPAELARRIEAQETRDGRALARHGSATERAWRQKGGLA